MTFVSVDLLSIEHLMEDLGDLAEEAARPAAQAAAQVLYDEVRRNVAAIPEKTGNLQRSIYQAFVAAQSTGGKAVYDVSWNFKKAPHGGLLEFGHLQRYVSYIGSDGKYYTAIRPGMRGKRKPSKRSPQSVKDAYYVTLSAPKQIAARSYVRRAASKFPDALAAAEKVLRDKLA